MLTLLMPGLLVFGLLVFGLLVFGLLVFGLLVFGLLVFGHQVMHEHVKGYHPDLAPEPRKELRIAGGLSDDVLIPGSAGRAGDLVEHLPVPLTGGDLIAVPLAEMGMQCPRPGREITPRAVHAVHSALPPSIPHTASSAGAGRRAWSTSWTRSITVMRSSLPVVLTASVYMTKSFGQATTK